MGVPFGMSHNEYFSCRAVGSFAGIPALGRIKRNRSEVIFCPFLMSAVANAERLPIDLLTNSAFVVSLVGDPRVP